MEYNSVRDRMTYHEYGRNIQKLIRHSISIEDDNERQRFVEKLILLMQNMNPQSRNNFEQKEKLWKHLMHIADYKLVVKVPDNINIDPAEIHKKPDPVPYPAENVRFLHYGKNVRSLIKKAVAMEDVEKKKAFAVVIGSYMKMAYKNWNRDQYISDEVIRKDVLKISEGKLELPEDAKLDTLVSSNNKRRNRPSQSKNRSNKGRRRK